MAMTIKDIAKRARVSYSAILRALNGIGVENTGNERNILRLAQEMGYALNRAATNLKKSRSHVVGLYLSTISKMTSPFVLHDVLAGAYSIARSKYNVVVKDIDMHEPGTLNPSYFNGIIVLSQRSEDMEFMNEIPDKKIPMVVTYRAVDVDAPNVTMDETLVMERAVDYLLEDGHRSIGIIEGNPGLDSSRLRRRGQRTSMTNHGLNLDTLSVIGGNYRYASGYTATEQLLTFQPTALLCFNDEMAFGARTAIVKTGLKVPDGISLVGFDNWDMSGCSDMHLITVEHNMGEIAKEGVRVLLRRLDGGIIDNRRICLNNRLVIRDTVKNLDVEERGPS